MYLNDLKTILTEVLSLGPEAAELHAGSPLLGALPELDSMAVVSLIGALEEHFGFTVDDDEINASVFATLGSLEQFVRFKLTA